MPVMYTNIDIFVYIAGELVHRHLIGAFDF